MAALQDQLQDIDKTRAIAGIILSCIAGISVHIVMLQIAHVPYPKGYPTAGRPVFCGLAGSAFAMLWLCQRIADRLDTLSLSVRILLIGLLASMLREALRVSILDGVVTSAWRYSFVSDLPRSVVPVFLACLCVPAARYVRQFPARMVGALVIGGLATYVFLPAFSSVLGHMLHSIQYLSHDEIYKVPYGWQVEVPSYITFLEPTIAAFLVATLVLDSLSPKLSVCTLQFALLIMALNTNLLRPLLYLPFSPFSAPMALLSMSQFFFEWAVLSVCIAVTWHVAAGRRSANLRRLSPTPGQSAGGCLDAPDAGAAAVACFPASPQPELSDRQARDSGEATEEHPRHRLEGTDHALRT